MTVSFTSLNNALFTAFAEETAGTYYRPDPDDADNPLAAARVDAIRTELDIDYPADIPLRDTAEIAFEVKAAEVVDTDGEEIEPSRAKNDRLEIGGEAFGVVHAKLDASTETYTLYCRRI